MNYQRQQAAGEPVAKTLRRIKRLEAEERGLIKLVNGQNAFGNPYPKTPEGIAVRQRQLDNVQMQLERERAKVD